MKPLAQWMLSEGDRHPDRIGRRVRTPPTPLEWIVIGSIVIILVASRGYPGHGIDWEIFAGAADGTFEQGPQLGYYYAYWLLPIFDFYALAGVALGGMLWAFTNMAGVWFAARVFGARPAVVLAGFGAISGLYTGTITGVALAAVAGLYWAVNDRRWTWAGVLSLVAVAKPQWGVALVVLIVVHARPPLTAWARLATAPVGVGLASLAAFGWWPGEILQRAGEYPPASNGSLWFFVGPVVLLLWIPALLPMEPRRRLSLVATLSVMAVPYVQQYDFVIVWVLTADGLGLLSHLEGLLSTAVGKEGSRGFQTFMPLASYVLLVTGPLQQWLERRGTSLGAAPATQ